MEYLYVCHFSNGHIKVGRSIEPKARIAAHADRVACMGVELVEHHIVECIGYRVPAELALIERCTKSATKRNKSEWFEGLDFSSVCEWCTQFANCIFDESGMSTIKSIRDKLGITQAELAKVLGCTQGNVSFYERGQTIPPDAAKILIAHAKMLGHEITFDDIYGDPAPADSAV